MVNEDFQYRFYEPYQPVEQYRCHLPHWRQEGVFYFVTFRLGDSLPLARLKSWAEERRIWLAANGITPDLCEKECAARYNKIPENVRRVFEQSQRGRFFIELDRCHGDCLLRNPHAASIVGNAMQFFHTKKLYCGDFVIMPNHVHWIVIPCPERKIEDLCGSVKQYSATHINKLFDRSGKLWQHENFDHIIRNEKELLRIRNYIHDNPTKAGLSSSEYRYYRATWIDDIS